MSIKKISLALASALALSVTSVQAIPYAPVASITPNGGVTTASDIYVNAAGIGEALHFPYFTTRDDKRSVFNVTNTSDQTVAVKVIVREGIESRHVLDFTIIMSPFDVFAGLIRGATAAEAADLTQRALDGELETFDRNYQFQEGHPVFARASDDSTCVVAAFDNDRSGDQIVERIEPLNHTIVDGVSVDAMKEGYVNMIASGAAVDADIIANSKAHTTAACNAIAAFFTETDEDKNYWNPRGTNQLTNKRAGPTHDAILNAAFDPAGNVLKGNFSIIDSEGGLGAGNQAIALADFNQSGNDLVTSHSYPYLFEPTLASSDGLWNAAGLDEVEIALSSNSVINEWANNPDNFAFMEWIQTFPTKAYYTVGTLTGTEPYNPRNVWRTNLATVTGAGSNPFIELSSASSGYGALCALYPYDREENRLTNGLRPSPAPYEECFLPYEVNVITFEDRLTYSPAASALLGSKLTTNFDLVDEFNDEANKGWLTLLYPAIANNYAFASGEAYAMADAIHMPSTGFAFKSVNRPGSDQSYNMIIDHSNVSSVLTPAPVTIAP